jgi:hypothetical protein
LADYAGFTAPAGLEGRSLRALIEGTDRGDQRVARSLVFHYDVTGKRDVPGRTVISRNWRYTEWAEGQAGRELYLRSEDPHEYRNRINDPAQAQTVTAAAAAIRALPAPKPGPANRPRAIAPADSKQ